MNYPKVEHLSGETIHFHSEIVNWYLRDWYIPFQRTQEEEENGYYEPIMNYFYPLPEEFRIPENIKELLDEVGVMTLVVLTDGDFERIGLALTGGGMDLTWDICRAYILLGYLPPIEFCRLPNFAGMDFKKPRNKVVVEAVKRSIEIAKANLDYLNGEVGRFE